MLRIFALFLWPVSDPRACFSLRSAQELECTGSEPVELQSAQYGTDCKGQKKFLEPVGNWCAARWCRCPVSHPRVLICSCAWRSAKSMHRYKVIAPFCNKKEKCEFSICRCEKTDPDKSCTLPSGKTQQ